MSNDYSEDTPEQDSQHYSMEIPNEETRQALEAVERREELCHAKDADDLFRQLHIKVRPARQKTFCRTGTAYFLWNTTFLLQEKGETSTRKIKVYPVIIFFRI